MNEKEFLSLVEKYKKKKKPFSDEEETTKTTTMTAGKTTGTTTNKDAEAFFGLVNQYKERDLGNRLQALFDRDVSTTKSLTDIVKEKEEKIDNSKLDFFQGSKLFDDGYNFGDVTKTILGTAGDAGLNVGKGAASLVEGVADLGMYTASAIANKTQSGDLEAEAQMKAQDILDKMMSERDFNAYASRLGHKGTYQEYVADVKAQAQEILETAQNGGVAASIKAKAQKNTVDDLTKGAQDYLDARSVLGRTSKGVFQGVGQVGGMLATGGLGAATGIGGTAATTATSLLSSWGNNMSQAYQEGASDADAWTYGAIAGAVDAGTELIFGGLGKGINAVGYSKGLTQADDILAKKVTNKITNQIAKNFAEYGIKAGAEGFEEVLAGTLQAITKGFTYKETEEEWTFENIGETLKHFANLIEDENLLEQFVVGAVTSGIAQSGYVPGMTDGSLREANKTGKDFITGQTQNEQAVIKRETEKRIAEAEKDGTKLTGRQKSSIEAQVESDLEKGYISTDTIEEVLGGDTYNAFKENVEGFMGSDTYKAYNEAVEEEKSLRQEFEELQKVKLTEADLGQQSRFTEVKNRLEEIKKESKSATLRKELDAEIKRINGLKNTLRQEVAEKVKNERLSESYNELTRSTEKFQADPAEYDNEFARKTVANIVKSGIANNTNETHEFVSFMAKISADKGVVFTMTDAERLAGTRYAKDGATTNAYVTSDGDIVINSDSKKRLNSLVGHEVTHVLEGSQLYGELQKAVFDYAQKKGDYDSRLKAITDLYQKYDPKADPKKELTADLVGDYLFTDKDFINKLSTENRNVFQKIYDEIKYLFKVATAGSKEARALEKAKKAFDAVYRENVKGKPQGKYSLSEQKPPTFEDLTKKDPTKIVKITDGIESGSYADMKKAALDKAKNEGWFDVPHHNNDTDSFIFLTEKSFSHAYSNLKSDFGEDTIRSMAHIPEIIREAVLVNVADPKNPTKAEKKVYTFFAAVEGVAGVEPVKLTVKEFDFKSLDSAPQNIRSYFEKNGIEDSYNSLYDARALEVIGIEGIKKESDASGEVYGKTPEARATSNSEISIAELLKIVKGDSEKYIPKTSTGDSAGGIENQDNRSLSPEQEEYFKDSVVRDENGNLKPMYHGTSQGGHTMFDPYGKAKYGLFGTGTYFTDSKAIAESYTTKGKGDAPQVYETYLNITNPIDMDAQADPEAWRNALPEADFPESGTNEQFYRAMEDYFEDMEYARWEASEIAMGVIEDMGYDGITHIGGGRVNADGERHQVYIAFQPEQIKNIDNAKPTSDPDIRKSLSAKGDTSGNTGGYAVYGDNIRVKDKSELDFAPIKEPAPVQEDIAPVRETVQEDIGPVREDVPAVFPDDGLPGAETDIDSLTDADVPPEVDAPYYDDADEVTPADPFANRDIKEVGNRKVNAYMYENPEVKPFFQAEANMMLGELERTTKGERFYNMDVYYDTNGEAGITGTSRHTSQDIAYLLDELKYSYKQIEAGLKAIIEDNGKENNAVSKRIEFLLNDRLMNGYQDPDYGWDYPPNQDYINLLNEKQITEYNEEARNALFASGDEYAPIVDAPVAKTVPADDLGPVAYEAIRPQREASGPVAGRDYEAVTPKKKKENKLVRRDVGTQEEQKIARVLDEEPKPENRRSRAWAKFKANMLDKGAVFETVALKNKNRELMGKWNYMLYSEARAQRLMGEGAEGIKSLNSIQEEVAATGKTQQFYEYLYHKHNVDRMRLADRYEEMANKPVFGFSVTAEMSENAVRQMERANPEFIAYAQDVYDYNNHLRQLLVDDGVISQETADQWTEMYPHYVPIRRAGETGININVPLDTGRTTVNAPVKKATGGNSDILPLFDTMAQRTLQTYKAIAKNSFGVELKNALGTTIENKATDVDDVIDTIDAQESLLQEGKNGRNPTFTVFENGEKVTYEITKDMYDALKPMSEGLAYTNKVLNTASNFHRGLLTEYNPVFMLTNAIKDVQDVLINSQHPGRTYAKVPEAFAQLTKKGYWYKEYMENGGDQNSYFDNETGTFKTENKGLAKLLDLPPLSTISKINNFIEMTPRLAEYIASREAGRSVEVSMLDAARVTTNFRAGGDVTKFLNRNGATFLNASVQGAMQQVRNFREAKANGFKGWVALATKFAIAGLPALLLNNLVWDDDEEYEELSDYVKQSYYVVGKTSDGKFIRIPKGRTLAVIQSAFDQVSNAVTGNDEVDLKSFLELAVSNLAPNNPIENNILAPIIQVANNETWYGEDLVPSRLQDLPAAEQFDESTDALSKWLGEKINVSPVKINYLLDQYTGGLGDVVLPMMTPEAESGDNSLSGNIMAPLKSKFTTDAVMNNQNVADFYDKKDELTTNAKASGATDKDILKNKYMNSINAELADLYAQKREIQNSALPDSQKYALVKQVQNQIIDITRESLDAYENVKIDGDYATVGNKYFKLNDEGEWQKLSDEQVTKYKVTSKAEGKSYATNGEDHYRWYQKEDEYEGEWRKVTDKELEKQKEVTKGLGISANEYWNKKEEYDYAYEYPENYAVSKAVGGYEVFKFYSSALYDIKADKDAEGKTISGSRKTRVLNYINGLDLDYGEKLVLFKSEYNADDTYNYEIIDYLNGRDDLSYSDVETILKKLGFKVSADGTISW